jgi:hypothetical protein
MILGTYDETYGELLEDQWLLKLRDDVQYGWDGKKHFAEKTYKTGFLTKLTKKGELPKAFEAWGGPQYGVSGHDLPIYVFQETYRSGWSLVSWRFGKSQNWARMRHPEGFHLEIYLDDLLNVIKNDSLDQGVIVGEYKWCDNKLIKK